MSELEPQTSASDPIAALHRMSTTAGVATQEYVAINNLAVTSVALGFFTLLAMISALFLVIAIASLICGIVAFRQIRNSNGTQTGRGLAALGILLSLGVTGFVIADTVRQANERHRQTQQINAAIEEIGKHIVAGQYVQAYAMFNADFQQNWTLQQFEQIWKMYQDPDNGYGPLRHIRGNNVVQMDQLGDGTLVAYTQAIIEFEKSPEPLRAPMTVQLPPGGQWQVKVFGTMFVRMRQ